MKNVNKLLIVLISIIFICSGLVAQKVETSKSVGQSKVQTILKEKPQNQAQYSVMTDKASSLQVIKPNSLFKGQVLETESGNFIPNKSSGKDLIQVFPISANYNTGSCNSTGFTQTSIMNGMEYETGFAKFDISAIPVGAVITSINFNGYVNATNYPYWSITSLPYDPLAASALDINTWITTHYESGIAYSYNMESSTFTTGWIMRPLEATAIADMQAALTQGWFSIGITDFDFSTSYYVTFDGWNETNIPYLEVDYFVPEFGALSGTVTSLATGNPMAGVSITAVGPYNTYSMLSLANGTYTFDPVQVGSYNITAELDGYNIINVTGIAVTAGNTTTQNFAMTAPTMDITPSAINVVVDPFGTATEMVDIANNGNGALAWEAEIEFLTDGKANAYAGLSKDVIANEDALKAGVIATGTKVPIDKLKSTSIPLQTTYQPNTPGPTDEIDIIGGMVNSYVNGPRTRGNMFTCTTEKLLVEFMGYHSVTTNPTQMWMLVYESDVQVGTYNLVVAIDITPAPIGTGWVSSGTVNYLLQAGKYYMIVASFEQMCGYYNDPAVNPFPYPVAFGEATGGAGYTYAPTSNFPPDATQEVPAEAFVDPVLYYQQLVTADPEFWLSIDPSMGDVDPGNTEQMAVHFDAGDIPAGTVKTANIHFTSVPEVGTFTIPVSMTVGSLQFGNITGTITLGGSLPYNIGDVTNVLITAGPYSTYPDASGNYDLPVYPGTYDVVGTLYGYETQTITGVVVGEGLTVSGQNMTLPCLYGIVTGTVTSVTTGLPIPGATVKLVGTTFQDLTDANGVYEIIVEAGVYDVKVNVVGYASQTAEDVSILAESTVTVDFNLADLEGIIVVIDLDGTPTGQALADVIQDFFPGGLVEYTTDINGVPLTEEVQSVFLLLGIYANNFVLTETEATVITTWMNAYDNRNLYMEGGDTWAFDTPTSLHSYFNITGVADGGADLSSVEGIGSFWTGQTWSYVGENNWIDHLDAIAPAINVLINPSMGYNCAVAYDAGTYKTVGASFEITGMTGGPGFPIGVACVMAWFGYPVFTYGSLEGYVTEIAGGAPVPAANITVGGIANGTTDASGYYYIDQVLTGTWTVNCTKDGYNPASATVTIVEDVLSTQSFQLTEPQFIVSSLVVNQTLEPNATGQQTLTLSNPGNGPVNWGASLNILSDGNGTKGSQAFAMKVYPAPVDVVSFDTDDPGTFTTIASGSGLDPFAGDFNNVNTSLLYVITYTSSSLYTIDINTGAETYIAPVTGITGGQSISGMACDKTTGIMYVATTSVSASDIYTIDLTTGVLTLIGTTGIPGLIEIAIDGTGTMYGWDIVNDESFVINKTTGASTVLGPLGIDLNYAQGGNWDPVSDVIYLAAYSASGQLMTLDKTTGALTYVGGFPGGAEVDALAFPGGFNAWLSIDPQNGTLNASGSSTMTLDFDATDLLPGFYYAEIHFSTDPDVGSPVVNVTLHVEGLIPATNLTLSYDCTDVILTWEMPAGGTPDSWNVYKNGVLLGNTTVMTFTDEMVMPGVEIGYYVRAVYAGEESMPTVTQYITVPTPSNLVPLGLEAITDVPNENDVTLNWDEPNACLAPDGYNIYRDGTQINTSLVTALTYVDPDLPIGLFEYYVKAVYYFGESNASSPVYTLITGVEDLNSDLFRIYPNPASSSVNIESAAAITGIQVINNAGQVVINEAVDVYQYQINVSKFEKGVYFIKITTSEGDKLCKITVN